MDNVKKQFVELYELLEANKNKKVNTIMPELVALMSKKTTGVTNAVQRDDEGNVTHIFCYYHKEWEAIDEVEYGKKTNSATGLNTMCKVGTSKWTKQQRVKKQANAELLTKVAKGELKPEDIAGEQARIDEESKIIIPLGE